MSSNGTNGSNSFYGSRVDKKASTTVVDFGNLEVTLSFRGWTPILSHPGALLQVRSEVQIRLSEFDASIMLTITTGNTNVPTIMVGEKAADLIKAIA